MDATLKSHSLDIGHEYGWWMVIGPPMTAAIWRGDQKALVYPCRCRCRTERLVPAFQLLRRGGSCGCLRREKLSDRSRTHGDSRPGKTRPLYRVWANMRTRCHNPNALKFPDYGGRGISVCPEWRASYEAFRDWADANGYDEGLQIDRIDNNGDYCPENCRWATAAQNMRNRRSTRFITAFGETKCMAEWVADRRCAVKAPTLHYRLKAGWDAEDAITKPAGF